MLEEKGEKAVGQGDGGCGGHKWYILDVLVMSCFFVVLDILCLIQMTMGPLQ